MKQSMKGEMSMRQIVGLGIVGVIVLSLIIFSGALFENLDAHEIMVIQSPWEGTLEVYTAPGVKWQGFGKVTKYPRRAQYSFDVEKNGTDNTKKLRFNDGGHANLSGSVSWEMPTTPKEIIAIHQKFGSAEGVERAAVASMINAAVYLAGPLMSSTESSGERRSELVQYINDQAENGVYVTTVKEKEVTDPITSLKKTVTVTEIQRDKDGNPRRQQGSILGEFNIKLLPMSISDLKYDGVVENQIKQRQEATTQVQIAIAQSKTAEQQKLTTEAQGAANAAKAKWEQETIKAKEVTLAEQKLAVATLGAKEAEQYKREQILRGEGDAQRKTLVMNADGALDPKLDAYKEVNAAYADAIAKAQPGAWTPAVVMGGSADGQKVNSAQGLVDFLMAKTAKDLALDMRVSGSTSKK